MANPAWRGDASTNTAPLSASRISADVIRYINKVDSDSGWLLVGSEDLPRLQWKSLFKCCKVMLIGSKNGRTYFKVLEGESKGQVSFLSDDNANEYLGKTAPKQQPVELVVTYGHFDPGWFSKSRNQQLQQQLARGVLGSIHFEVAMNTSWNGDFYPIPPGTYSILLPDFPHKKDYTNQYKTEYSRLSHHQVWFPISYGNNSRYVHVGNVSEGCATVLSLSSWSSIHEMLVSHRSADGNGVGTLIVKGKPERNR
ncbi:MULTISPECIES: hypothetical protein [Burkholderia]|uniref:hypothetical protein n=1 Tax=Burkholderia TaxID=32008 RepID=UPI001178B784|nr:MULTISPECIES: hypothetical protein [Burkholderia]MBY4725684.1 hypothetical protein [Burkholderia contaminans]MCI3968068.1 hypothetical protein [Burkholderia sp. HI4860]MDN7788429.1 hypothetical protein [Burkholderia contaminans]